MEFLPILVIIGLIVLAMLITYWLYKRFKKMMQSSSHRDYELRYIAPGKPETVLSTLAKADYVDGFYNGFISDGQILMVWRSSLGGRMEYQVQLWEKGDHTEILLTLYSFSIGGRKLDMDAFMRAKLNAQRVNGGK